MCFRGKSLPYSLDVPLVGGEFQREGIRRRAIGKCFFLAARALTGHTRPWGMLTGVRPVKLPTRALLSGATPLQAKQELREEYYVSPDRAALAVDCAQASIAAQRSLKEGEVSLYLGIPFCPTPVSYTHLHQGVVGIVASRLAEKYARPCFMICLDQGMGKGSCRSWGGVNLFEFLEELSLIHICRRRDGEDWLPEGGSGGDDPCG